MDVDLDLQLSCERIKENMIMDIVQISRNGEILDMDPFPSPLGLAMLAKAVYSDDDVELPKGWKYLTTAFNKSRGNGYFGAACWCPEIQQVVIGHRGTDITNVAHLQTNIMGVMNTEYTHQMNSAITFADMIMTVLCEVNEEKGAGLQLSLTGHSLGGWLAQVTAFTLEYVQRDGDHFIRRLDRPPGRHVHTVTFDTPGCGEMLKKIIDDGHYGYRETVSPDHLDITNYLAPPNKINTTGSHVGTIHLVNIDISQFGIFSKHTPWYNIAIHRIDNFVMALGGGEYEKSRTDCTLSFAEEEKQQKTLIKEIRYKTEDVTYSCNLRVFSEKEIYLLELWSTLKAETMKMDRVNKFVERHDLGTVSGLFEDFVTDVKNRTVTCQNSTSLQAVIRHIKQLMRWFHPEFLGAVERQTAQVPKAGPFMYRMIARNYLDSVPECHLNFKDTIGLKVFLEFSEARILHIESGDGQFQVAVLYNLLSQMWKMSQTEHLDTYLRPDRQTFMDFGQMRDLNRTVDFESLYHSEYSGDDLLVIDSTLDRPDTGIFERFTSNAHKKLIIISSPQINCKRFLESSNVSFTTVTCAQLGLGDLTEDSQRELFSRKMLTIGGKQFSLADYTNIQHVSKLVSHFDSYIDRHIFKEILTDQKFTLKMEAALLSHDDLKVHSTVNKKMSVARVARNLREHSGEALLVISGIGREELETDLWRELVRALGEKRISTTTGDGESVFKQMCREDPSATIYWIAASAGLVYFQTIYKKEFYIERKFVVLKYIFDFKKFAQMTNKDINKKNIFVFKNIKDKPTLISPLPISEGDKFILLRSECIKTAATPVEADDIIERNPGKAVHILKLEPIGGWILWQRSRGSLEGLRPYVTPGMGESVDEGELRNMVQKVVIIADEPGMGKSTSLTSVSRLLRSSAWVIRVDLKDFTIPIQELPTNLSLNSVCEFILRDEDSWLRGLLHFCLDKHNKHSREVYLLFDGFDEIKQNHSEIKNCAAEVLRLLEYLNSETTAKIWITTRLYRREMLENDISIFAMQFEKVSESCQREYLVQFWRPHLLLELDQYGDAEERKVEDCAEYVFQNAKQVLGDDVQNFMGIPLQMRMLADVSMQQVKVYLESEPNIENIFNVKSVFDLYQQFVRLKYDIYFRDKTGLDAVMSGKMKHSNVEQLTEKHRLLALRTLFPEFAKEHFDAPEAGWGDELCRVGLVQAGGGRGENVEFIHRTLAEHFCADLAVHWLRKKGRYHGHVPMVELLLSEILVRDSHNVIRVFLNNLVLSQPLTEDADKFFALKINELWCRNIKQHYLFDQRKGTALHVATRELNTGIITILVGGLNCAPAQKELIGFVAAHDRYCRTALSQAAQLAGDVSTSGIVKCASTEIMKKFVQSIETCSHKVILELLLATYIRYTNVFDDEIKCLSEYVGEATHPAINKAFIRTQKIIHKYIPRLHRAMDGSGSMNCISFITGRSSRSRAGGVEKLYGEMKSDTERLYMLLAPGGGQMRGGTVLHRAAEGGGNEGQSKIQTQIIKILCNQNISQVGRSYDASGMTPLHRAAAAGHLEIVEHLINRGVYTDSLTKGDETALFYAARAGRLPVVECLVEKGSDITIVNTLGQTALDIATENRHQPVTEYLEQKLADRRGATARRLPDYIVAEKCLL